MMNKPGNVTVQLILIAIILGLGFLLFRAHDPFLMFSKKEEVIKKSEPAQEVAPSKKDDSLVLCRIDGKPAITENDFVNNITQMLNANPYFRGAGLDALPAAIKRKFFDELIKQALIIEDSRKNNIESDPEFVKALNDMVELVKRSLIVQFFEKRIFDGIEITDKKVEQYFDDNKDKYVKVNGGVLLSSVSFDEASAAEAFLKKASEKIDEFDKLAKEEAGGTFRDFGRVSSSPDQQSFRFESVPSQLKKAALNVKTLPGVDSVKIDSKHYVFKVSDRQETEYFSLDEVRSQVEGMMKNNQFKEILDKRISAMRSDYDVSINESYFIDKASEDDTNDESEGEASPSTDE